MFGVTQQATATTTSEFNFSRMVFVQYPKDDMISMGLVTGRVHAPGRDEESLIIVYIPSIPNPMSGNMVVMAEDDVLETDLSVEDAMKLVFSGGMAAPGAISFAKVPESLRNHSGFIGRFKSD